MIFLLGNAFAILRTCPPHAHPISSIVFPFGLCFRMALIMVFVAVGVAGIGGEPANGERMKVNAIISRMMTRIRRKRSIYSRSISIIAMWKA